MSQHVPTDTTGNAETPPNPIICNKIPKTLRDTTRNAHRQHSKHVDVVAVAVVVVVVIVVIVAVVVVTLLPLRAPPCAAGVGGQPGSVDITLTALHCSQLSESFNLWEGDSDGQGLWEGLFAMYCWVWSRHFLSQI